MSKVVPHKIDFDIVSKVEKINTLILYLSALLSCLLLFVDEGADDKIKNSFLGVTSKFLAILSIVYFMLSIVENYLFHSAELVRRNDFIDNSLNTNISEKKSLDYFTNESLPAGTHKMGVNCFENVFFSKFIARKMITSYALKSLTIVTLFLCASFLTTQKTLLVLLQIPLPFTILVKTIRLLVLHSNLEKVYTNFVSIFCFAQVNKRDALIIENVITYEKSLSWGGVLLSSNIFKQFNEKLTDEWKNLKIRYSLT